MTDDGGDDVITLPASQLRLRHRELVAAIRAGGDVRVTYHDTPLMRCIPEGRFRQLVKSEQALRGLHGLATLLTEGEPAVLRDLGTALRGLTEVLAPVDDEHEHDDERRCA